jgi:hypothetical protein
MSSFAAASTIPVTNKVAHANSRKSLRIRVITSPMRTAPCTADVPGLAADVMGIPPTLRKTPDGSIGSPARRFFSLLCFRSVPNFNGALNLIAHQLDCLKKLRFGDRLHVGEVFDCNFIFEEAAGRGRENPPAPKKWHFYFGFLFTSLPRNGDVPCVDGSVLARAFFTFAAWSVQPCVRPLDAVHMTAGHNALRGSGPGQKPAFDKQCDGTSGLS